MPLQLWRDASQVATERGQSFSEHVRDALEREQATEVIEWRTAVAIEQRQWEEWREQHYHPRRTQEALTRKRLARAAALAEQAAQEMLDASPIAEAAIRSEAIRRRQKRGHHGRQSPKGTDR